MANGYMGKGRPGKILPPFVKTEKDLDREVDGVALRELWKRVAVKYFGNDPDREIDYEISDSMILKYSEQFETLSDFIGQHVSGMRTWHQLARDEGQGGPHPHPDGSYFAIEWFLSPVRRGPMENACGCGCGCG